MMNQDRKFRPDIEGMRALAVILVVLGHFGILFKGGFIGVDIFFVISGFLITRILIREYDESKTISLSNFYARRIRRILPAATLVIGVVIVAATTLLSYLRLHEIGIDALFSTFSAMNYHLAIIGTDYFSIGGMVSPLQHFWSLAVEEQFYIIWPGLFMVTAYFARKSSNYKKYITGLLFVIISISLFESLRLTAISQPWAYFGTATRSWELACGALLALQYNFIATLPKKIAQFSSWFGITAIIMSALLYSETTPYPGIAALVPVLATMLIIASHAHDLHLSSESILKRRVFQFFGKISYSWYLWHWPIYVFATEILKRTLHTPEKIILILLSIVLSILTFYIIEKPFHYNKTLVASNKKTFILGGILIIIIIAELLLYNVMPNIFAKNSKIVVSASSKEILKSVQLGTTLNKIPENMSQSLISVLSDKAPTECMDATEAEYPTKKRTCILGDTSSSKKIVLLGDSHANQWTTPIADISKKHNYKLLTYTKPGCPAFDAVAKNQITKTDYTECYTWRKGAINEIVALHPNYVILSSFIGYVDQLNMVDLAKNFIKNDIKVIYLMDTPHPDSSVPECISKNESSIQQCSLKEDVATKLKIKAALVKDLYKNNVNVVNTTAWFCYDNICPPIINNMYVYYDSSHVSNTYATYLSDVLEESLNLE